MPVFIGEDIVCTRLDRSLQHRIGIASRCRIGNFAHPAEHEGGRTCGTQLAASLGEVGPDV